MDARKILDFPHFISDFVHRMLHPRPLFLDIRGHPIGRHCRFIRHFFRIFGGYPCGRFSKFET